VVRVEGIEFDLGSPPRSVSAVVIAARDAELMVVGCVFRAAVESDAARRLAGIAVTPPGEAGLGPRAGRTLRLDGCAFVGRLTGVAAEGPLDLAVRDGVFAGGPLVRVEGPIAGRPVPVDVHLVGVRAIPGDEPALGLVNAEARVVAEDCVVAATGAGRATLVAIDDPARLDWRGRDNLYGRIDPFVGPTAGSTAAPIGTFAAWAEGGGGREVRSSFTEGSAWAEADPIGWLARRGDPGRALRLARAEAPATVGPDGRRESPLDRVSASLSRIVGATLAAGRRPDGDAAPPGTTRDPAPEPTAMRTVGRPGPMPIAPPPALAEAPGVPETDVMPPMNQADPVDLAAEMPPAPMFPFDDPPEVEEAPEAAPAEAARSVGSDRVLVRTADDWREATLALSGRGGVVRLAADARFELGGAEVPRGGRWIVQAEPGPTRPRIRLRLGAGDLRVDGSAALFRLAPGAALELRDVDLVAVAGEQPAGWSGAAFALAPGADLSLIRCTATLVPDEMLGAATPLLRLAEAGEGGGSGATVRVEDSFLRCGGDAIEVGAGLRFDVALSGTVVAAGGSALHGVGSARAAAGERSKLSLRQCLVRAAGGLVRLRGTATGPELPAVEVQARDTILATTPRGDALLRLEGRGDAEALRDRVTWDGHGVVYHLIDVYRLDESAAAGATAAPYRRLSWNVAVGPREEDPFHGDARFVTPMTSDQVPWRLGLDDVRLAPGSPVDGAGPRLDRVPGPPPA
jgi:serine/threonine-protein kinase